jgi:DNA-binding HxlR family transcriptional regulator
MPDWDGAPVTKAALWASPQERGPSALEREWATQLGAEGDFILLVAGCSRREGETHSWTALWWNVSEAGADPDLQRGRAASAPAGSVERFVAPFAREGRVRLMQELYAGARSAGELSQATGTASGALHSRLEELTQASLVEKRADGRYALTVLGCNLLLTITGLAGVTVQDRGPGGLVMGAERLG